MQYYNIHTDTIKTTNDGWITTGTGRLATSRMTTEQLKNLGYFEFIRPPETENTEYNRLTSSPMVLIEGTYTVTYIYEDIPLEEMKVIRMAALSDEILADNKPRITVPLEDTSTIDIWGSRENEYDLRSRYDLMIEDSKPNLHQRDTDGIFHYLFHLDVKRCLKAINIYKDDMIEYQWSKEKEIQDSGTIEELKLVTWTI